jgi:hypothetical protein
VYAPLQRGSGDGPGGRSQKKRWIDRLPPVSFSLGLRNRHATKVLNDVMTYHSPRELHAAAVVFGLLAPECATSSAGSVLCYEPQVRACAHMQVFMEYRLHRQPWASSLRRFVGIHGVNYQYLRRQNIPMKAMNDGNERKNDGMARQPLPPRASHSSAEVVSFEPSSGCGNRGRGNCRRPLHDPGGGGRRP